MIQTMVGTPVRLTASRVVSKAPGGCLIGVLCAASTAGTIILTDDTTGAGTTLIGTLSLTAGQYTPIPLAFANGLYCTVGGTLDATFFVGA